MDRWGASVALWRRRGATDRGDGAGDRRERKARCAACAPRVRARGGDRRGPLGSAPLRAALPDLVEADPRAAGRAVESARRRCRRARAAGARGARGGAQDARLRALPARRRGRRRERRPRGRGDRDRASPGSGRLTPSSAGSRRSSRGATRTCAGRCSRPRRRRTGTGTSFASGKERRGSALPPRTSSIGSFSPTTRACSTPPVRMSRPWRVTCRGGSSNRYRKEVGFGRWPHEAPARVTEMQALAAGKASRASALLPQVRDRPHLVAAAERCRACPIGERSHAGGLGGRPGARAADDGR